MSDDTTARERAAAEFMPRTRDVRGHYQFWGDERGGLTREQSGAEFDRWLAAHDAEVVAALRSRQSERDAETGGDYAHGPVVQDDGTLALPCGSLWGGADRGNYEVDHWPGCATCLANFGPAPVRQSDEGEREALAEVSSVADLEALPIGSVIRTSGYEDLPPRVAAKRDIYQRYLFGEPTHKVSEWAVADGDLDGGTVDSSELDDLPATVLFIPRKVVS